MSSHQKVLNRGRQLGRKVVAGAGNFRRRLLEAEGLVQAGQTPFEVVHRSDLVQLRYYPPLPEEHIVVGGQRLPVAAKTFPVPLVLVPPLAVNMLLYDLFPQRSLVRYLRARGFAVYLIDWGRPGRRHNRCNLATYIGEWMPNMLEAVRRHSGAQRLSLHGWSIGGMFAYCHAALSADPDIANLVTVGAPCDYHADTPLGRQYRRLARGLRFARQHGRWNPHRTPAGLWRSPGWANALAYKLVDPVATLRGYAELLGRLPDDDYVAAHATNGAFLDDMVAYPGAVMQDFIHYLWTDNVLAQGQLPIHGCEARLDGIRASALVVGSERDSVVPLASTAPLLDLLTGSADRQLLEVPGGHMGILGGSGAPQQIWPQVADWLAARSAG